MYKKLLFGFSIILCIIFSFTFCFAADVVQDAVNGIRNVVGGAENAIEDTAKNISNASRTATDNMEKGANNIMNQVENMDNNTTNYDTTRTATRAATETETDATFMGMSGDTWTWLILGIAAIAIIALVWYYSMQLTSNNYHDRND